MFEGFSQNTIDFMWGIRFNNERSWFLEHKEVYQTQFLHPMKELAAQVQGAVNDAFPEARMNSKVSRIYRDARRLFGRGPYKDHMWFTLFQGDGREEGLRPVLWFELAPEGWSYGMGFFHAKPAIMERHRARIRLRPAPLLSLQRLLEKQDTFSLTGPDYARPRLCPDPRLQSWYDKRSLALEYSGPLTEELYHPALAGRLVEDFSFLMPFYDYFSTLWADPDPREGS
jgi:uncharacterized protein (TIGR02453 family)